MKRSLVTMAVMAALSTSAFAAESGSADGVLGAGLSGWAEMGARTAVNWRGLDLSDRQASVGLGGGIRHDSGAYLAGNLNTVKLPNDLGMYRGGGQYMLDTTLGYLTDVGNGVALGVAYTDYRFGGGNGVRNYNFGEVGVHAAWNGATVAYTYVVDGNSYRVPGMSQGDRYLDMGYTHRFGPASVGANVGYAWYDAPGLESGWRQVSLNAGYQLTHNLEVTAAYQVGGRDALKNKWDHNDRLIVGARYVF